MRFTELPREELAALNQKAIENIRVNGVEVPAYWIDGEEAAALAGITEVVPKTEPRKDPEGNPVKDPETGEVQTTEVMPPADFSVKVGGEMKRYHLAKNVANRPFSIENGKLIRDRVLQGRYVLNGETMIVGDDEQGISLQHRCVGIFLASLEDETVRVPALLVTGVPSAFADTADTGRSRSNADAIFRQTDVLKIEDLESFDDLGFGPDGIKVRKSLVRDMASAIRLLWLRLNGKDVNASGKVGQAEMFRVYNAFGKSLESLVNEVYNYDVGRTDQSTFGKLLGRPNVIAALALWQASAHGSPIIEELSDNVTEAFLPLDLSECGEILQALTEANTSETSDAGKRLGQIAAANKSGAKQPKHYKFASIVNFIKYASGAEDEVKGVKSPGSVLPKESSLKADNYPHFGAPDAPKPKKEKKAKDEE